MKIKKIDIYNFKGIEKAEGIEMQDYNCFVGPNGSGKSTVLEALNIFFGKTNKFNDEHFFKHKTEKPISIKVTFTSLSQEAKETFDHYVRNDDLVICVEISKNAESYDKKVYVERFVFEEFASFFTAESAASGKEIFDELRTKYPDIASASTAKARGEALKAYEASLPDSEKKLMPSGEEFFGVSKGADKLKKHIHWVYVPAVKDAVAESEEAKSTHIGELIQHTVKSGMDYDTSLDAIQKEALRAYQELLDQQGEHLKGLEEKLSERLESSVTSKAGLNLDWKKDDKSVSVAEPVAQVLLSDGDFSGPVDSFGHGLQRTFLIVILQELLSVDSESSPTLIFGCEEPELYQHPPQAKHLASVLSGLAERDAQIFLTTHSPYFIDIEYYEGLKMFKNNGSGVSITSSTFASIMTEYNKISDKPLRSEDQTKTKLSLKMLPQYNELFFAAKVVLVEGISDQAYLEAYLQLSGKYNDFQRSGVSVLVAQGKSHLILLLIMAQAFEIPVYTVFDCDGHADADKLPQHLIENKSLATLSGFTMEDFPSETLVEENFTAWKHDIEEEIEKGLGDDMQSICQSARSLVGNLGGCKKYPLYISALMSEAWEKDKKFPILEEVVDKILQ